jgi:4'-phosphopantetheinyl transferase
VVAPLLMDSVQLTESERTYLTGQVSNEQLSDIFLLWTLKEAYSKALGLGLGLDFSRIEYDFSSKTVTVDGITPVGWKVRLFDFLLGESRYRCCIAEKKRSENGFRLSRTEPEVRRMDIATLISELSTSTKTS